MQIQINTDHTIEAHQPLVSHLGGVIEHALSQLAEHISRIEVHLSDESGPGKDGHSKQKRCLMETRIDGTHSLAVSAHGDTVHQCVAAAADKLARRVESTLGRRHDHRHRPAPLTPDEESAADDSPTERILS